MAAPPLQDNDWGGMTRLATLGAPELASCNPDYPADTRSSRIRHESSLFVPTLGTLFKHGGGARPGPL